jgi:hypothetical protein
MLPWGTERKTPGVRQRQDSEERDSSRRGDWHTPERPSNQPIGGGIHSVTT